MKRVAFVHSPDPALRLNAMGLSSQQARAALRFSLGRSTTVEQVDRVADVLTGIIKKLRELSSL